MSFRASLLAAVLGATSWASAQVTAPPVVLTVSVQDPRGHVLTHLRPQNFAVFVDGVRQKDVDVHIDHARITLGALLEGGGRYQQLNKILATEVPYMARPLLDAIEQDDTVGVFAYADEVRPLADLGHHSREELESAITRVPAAGFSESNLYDAILTLLDRMKPVEGRKAVLLLSTGIDTFSHATFEDVLKAGDAARTPVYAVAIGPLVERTVIGEAGPIAAIDWARATEQLRKLAAVSGGRAYVRNTDLDIPAVYDDMMEHLRVRYIVKYTPPSPATSGHTPSVRVALVDPRTGKAIPAKIRIEKDDAAVS